MASLTAFGDRRLDADLCRILAVREPVRAQSARKTPFLGAIAVLALGATVLAGAQAFAPELRLFGAPARQAALAEMDSAILTAEASLEPNPAIAPAPTPTAVPDPEPDEAAAAESEPEAPPKPAPAATSAPERARPERDPPRTARRASAAPAAVGQRPRAPENRIDVVGRRQTPRNVRNAGPRNTVRMTGASSGRTAPAGPRRGPQHIR